MPFTPQSIDFLAENRLQDNRDWFEAHKQDFEALVREPLLALSTSMGPAMQKIDPLLVTDPKKTISRIRRDTRFTHDKSLYRDNMWIVFHRGKGMLWPTWFFEVSPRGYAWGVGYWNTPVQVRDKVAEWTLGGDARWKAAHKALKKLPHAQLDGERFKRARYKEATPEQSLWAECKALSISHSGKDPDVLFSDALADMIVKDLNALRPCYELMAAAHLEVESDLPQRGR